MTLGSYIKKIIAPSLKENGYEYLGNVGSGLWAFVKKKEHQKQITFQKSQIVRNAFAVILEINQKPMMNPPVNLIKFDKEQTNTYWWEYKEDTIESILLYVTKLIIDCGIPYLDEVSTPDLEPLDSLFSPLVENAEKLAIEFNTEIGISEIQSGYVETVRDKLLERIKSCNSPNWDLILKASAAIGEYIIKQHGGKWDWLENSNISGVFNIGEKNMAVSPIMWVSHFWGKPYVYGYDLNDNYIGFLIDLYGGRSKIRNV